MSEKEEVSTKTFPKFGDLESVQAGDWIEGRKEHSNACTKWHANFEAFIKKPKQKYDKDNYPVFIRFQGRTYISQKEILG